MLQAELIKYIEQYKKIIREYYGRANAKEANAYIYRMKITRKQLSQCDNEKLKKVCRNVIFEIKEFIKKREKDLTGRVKSFKLNELELLIKNLGEELEKNIVENYITDAPNARGREVWRNIINLIQYLILDKNFDSNFKSPEESVNIIIEKGTKEEIIYCFNLLDKSDLIWCKKLSVNFIIN